VLLVVVLLSAYGAMALVQVAGPVRRARLAQEALQMRVSLLEGIERAMNPLNLPLLCLSAPLIPFREMRATKPGGHVEIRWRHIGNGIILTEVDAVGPSDGRARAIFWLTPDSLERSEHGVRCVGSRLRPLASGALFPRPGE
jgi:hypothetical protein